MRGTIAAVVLTAAAFAVAGPASAKTEASRPWYQQPWNLARVKPCERACLKGLMDDYLTAMIAKKPDSLPLSEGIRITENTAPVKLGAGILWRAVLKPTAFKIYVVDPQSQQVALQTVLDVDGRPALVAIRIKVDRSHISQIEQLVDRKMAPQAMALLKTPRRGLVRMLPKSERDSRTMLLWAANSYFDALSGDHGDIGAFAKDCVRHENGYQTVNNPKPGRAAPRPELPNPKTRMGRAFAKLSMMTCEQQVDTKIFSFITRIWPRRFVVDEQKGLVAAFPLFVEDGTRRVNKLENLPGHISEKGVGMVTNMITMETFAIHGGKIHDIEAFPFITIPYGLGDGWDMGSGH